MLGGVPGEPAVQGGKCRRHREGDHQQKADRHHQAKRAQAIQQEALRLAPRVGLHAPDRVQRPLKFEECASGSDDEGDAAEDGGENASPSLAGALEKTLYGACTLGSDEVIELSNNFPADGLGAEHHARDSGCDEQDWRDRKQRVVGERCAQADGVVIPPCLRRRPEDCRNGCRAREHHSSGAGTESRPPLRTSVRRRRLDLRRHPSEAPRSNLTPSNSGPAGCL